MKILNAKIEFGVLKTDTGDVVNCPILGEGGDSEGFIVIAEGKIVYLPKTSPDLKTTLTILSELISILAAEIHHANLGGDITAETYAKHLAEKKQEVETLIEGLR